jgi:hypothetical protein
MRTKITLLLSLFFIASCSDENSKIRGQFIAGCIHSGVPKSICSCTFKKLESKYTPTELYELNQPYKVPPGSFMKDVMESALSCRNI